MDQIQLDTIQLQIHLQFYPIFFYLAYLRLLIFIGTSRIHILQFVNTLLTLLFEELDDIQYSIRLIIDHKLSHFDIHNTIDILVLMMFLVDIQYIDIYDLLYLIALNYIP